MNNQKAPQYADVSRRVQQCLCTTARQNNYWAQWAGHGTNATPPTSQPAAASGSASEAGPSRTAE